MSFINIKSKSLFFLSHVFCILPAFSTSRSRRERAHFHGAGVLHRAAAHRSERFDPSSRDGGCESGRNGSSTAGTGDNRAKEKTRWNRRALSNRGSHHLPPGNVCYHSRSRWHVLPLVAVIQHCTMLLRNSEVKHWHAICRIKIDYTTMKVSVGWILKRNKR